ncbi:MAG: hypothetical protein R6V10_12020 [bacterium]
MKKDDARFIAALCVTILLAVSVVALVHHRNREEATVSTVDVSSLEKLEQKGVISLHPADHWESLEKTERVSADIPLMERKARQGKLSLHQADHWQEVPGR